MKRKLVAFMNAYSQGKTGGDIAYIEIFKRLNKNFDLTTITSDLGKKLCESRGLKSKFMITSKEKRFNFIIPIYFFRIFKAFFFRIKPGSGDILYGTSDSLPDTLPITYLKIKNPKIKWIQKIFHLIPSDRIISHWSQKLSFYFIKKYSDHIIVDNKRLKNDLVNKGFNAKKISVNYLGVDADYFNKIKPSTKKFDACFMARIHLSKGIFDLVKIWSKVVKKIPKSQLVVIGTGQDTIIKKLKDSISQYKLNNNIELLGYLEDNQAFSVIKSSNIFLFPSNEEGFGIAVLEAQAMGIPVITWDLPVFKEIFKMGLIKIRKGEIDNFTKQVLQLLTDQRIYKQISEDAKNNAYNFNWKKTVENEYYLIKNA